MGDPLRVARGDGDRVAAADEQVPGVEAQPDRGCRRAPARSPRRSRPSCRRAGAGSRVSPRPRGGVGDPVEVGEQRRPAGVVEDRARRRTPPRPVAAASTTVRGAGRDERRPCARSTSGSGSWPGSCRTTGTNCADRLAARTRRARAPCSAGRRAGTRPGRTRSPRSPSSAIWRSTRLRVELATPARAPRTRPRRSGAPAMRSDQAAAPARALTGQRSLDLGQVDGPALAPRELARLGDAERLRGRRRRCTGEGRSPARRPRRRR